MGQGGIALPMSRKLILVKNENFQGYGCSMCNWVFNPSGPFVGNTLHEMISKYKAQRDKDFAAHLCAESPKSPKSNQ